MLALLLCLLQGALLVHSVRVAEQAADVADQALSSISDGVRDEPGVTGLLRRFFVPMSFRDPQVERIADLPYGEQGPRHKLDVYRRATVRPAVPRCCRCTAARG